MCRNPPDVPAGTHQKRRCVASQRLVGYAKKANPPYISQKDYLKLNPSVRNYEPRMALTDEREGTFFLKGILTRLPQKLKTKALAFLEFGIGMQTEIQEILSSFKMLKWTFIQDLQGVDRVVQIKKISCS